MTTSGGERIMASVEQDEVRDKIYELAFACESKTPVQLRDIVTEYTPLLRNSIDNEKRKTVAASCLPKVFRYIAAAKKTLGEADAPLFTAFENLIFERIEDFCDDSPDSVFNVCLNNVFNLYKDVNNQIDLATFTWVSQLMSQLALLRPRDARVEKVLRKMFAESAAVVTGVILGRIAGEGTENSDCIPLLEMLEEHSAATVAAAKQLDAVPEALRPDLSVKIVEAFRRLSAQPVAVVRKLASLAVKLAIPAPVLVSIVAERAVLPLDRRVAALGVFVPTIVAAAKKETDGPTGVKALVTELVQVAAEDATVELVGGATPAGIEKATRLLILAVDIADAAPATSAAERIVTTALEALSVAIPSDDNTTTADLAAPAPAPDAVPSADVAWSLLEAALKVIHRYGSQGLEFIGAKGIAVAGATVDAAVLTTLPNRLAFALRTARIYVALLNHKVKAIVDAIKGGAPAPRALAESRAAAALLSSVVADLETLIVKKIIKASPNAPSWRGFNRNLRAGGRGGRGGRGDAPAAAQKRARSPPHTAPVARGGRPQSGGGRGQQPAPARGGAQGGRGQQPAKAQPAGKVQPARGQQQQQQGGRGRGASREAPRARWNH